jgi:hypothetical protein
MRSSLAGTIISSLHGTPWQIRASKRFARVLALIAVCATPAMAEEQSQVSFQLPKNDTAQAEALANQIAALSPRVDRKEATLLADCAYATVSRLRRQYSMFGTPIFNNFLVYHGLRKRGYCWQWTEDLLVQFDALKLKTLEFHWGEAYAGTWRENNCVVITANGQPFNQGVILDAWRHFGHLRWNLVPSDEDRYFENAKWAQRVRARAASRGARTDRHVAFQAKVAPRGKTGDQ